MNQKNKIKDLISENRVGIFTTQNNGKIFSRPIAYADVDSDNNVWFFTDIHSDKIIDLANSNQVNFSFANHSDNEYVSLSGEAKLVTDPKIIDEKWSFIVKAWFPEGKQADRLALIKVVPESVQYWDGTSSKVIRLYDMAKALLTNKSYVEVADSDNKIVDYTNN